MPPQPNSPPDTVFDSYRPWKGTYNPEGGPQGPAPPHRISKETMKVVVVHRRSKAPTYSTPLMSLHKVGLESSSTGLLPCWFCQAHSRPTNQWMFAMPAYSVRHTQMELLEQGWPASFHETFHKTVTTMVVPRKHNKFGDNRYLILSWFVREQSVFRIISETSTQKTYSLWTTSASIQLLC